ncbi:Transcriptional regulator [Lysobacter dokdonensis DS-58]|uniref:Transcriptional regulator n=1 Tax=Lysobacter dokdonensis DS-58 TaxID=1300345 RepID=A0A0A2WEN5_9GAMM|nr:response regulator transcription factor [Lysobacter dokdonensis]KGQ18208.1 Transcriptional regulator [Lysobacter dokdonensis DS-58]
MSERPQNILVIDDEPELRAFLTRVLRSHGYTVDSAATGRQGLESFAQRGASLVLLDIGLPDVSGLDVLAHIRRDASTPVIALSVRAEESEKVAALDGGADDYVTKPFGVQELLARIRANLRSRHPVAQRAYLDDGYLRIDLANRIVALGNTPVTLTPKEYALLAVLARNAGVVVTQSRLLRELWGPTYEQDTHYLRILVAKLRQKLGDDATAPRWILTEPGVGLRLRIDGDALAGAPEGLVRTE